jgi:hypothetical protein
MLDALSSRLADAVDAPCEIDVQLEYRGDRLPPVLLA